MILYAELVPVVWAMMVMDYLMLSTITLIAQAEVVWMVLKLAIGFQLFDANVAVQETAVMWSIKPASG